MTTIQTKFRIGEEIFFLSNKKVCKSTVQEIKIHITPPVKKDLGVEIIYLCNSLPDSGSMVKLKVSEEDAFESKELLLKAL